MKVAVFQSAIYVASLESARQIVLYETGNGEAKQIQAIPNPALSAISTSLKGVMALQKAMEMGVNAIMVTRMGIECEKRARESGLKVIMVKEGTRASDALREAINQLNG
ncbi:MAG: NifB/NifX family molybdenum-iron cluster-binding protein [Thermocladium sp.]|mgnify:FL=1